MADRFAVEGVLGSGGMGIVLRARDLESGETVALKVPRKGRLLTKRLQLLAEADALRSVRHPHVVRPLCWGVSRQGDAYLAMELVEGDTVASQIARGGSLAPSLVARVVREAADALECLHSAGLVHRDVKPGNFLLRRSDESTVLIDFGLAVSGRRDESGFTIRESGWILGTPAYLSPEYARHGSSCPASDQFALAISAYEMLTGRLPWLCTSPTAMVAAILMDDPPAASTLAPRLPKAVDTVLGRGLRKEPSERYPGARAFGEALATALDA